MKRVGYSLWALGILLFVHCGVAQAQKSSPGGAYTPQTSPYLGLLNRGAPAAVNYYANVQPRQQAIDAFNRQDQINQEIYNQDTSQGVLYTGYRSGFFTHQRYFMTTGRGIPAGAGLQQQTLGAFQPTTGRGYSGGTGAAAYGARYR
jgi:hypothetical protein